MRGWLYDRLLVHTTRAWYGHALAEVPKGGRMLDVGIGTAGALLAHAALIERRDLHVVGVDIDEDYVRRARRRVAAAGLGHRVDVRHEPLASHAGAYDVVYFAGSFMLFDDPVAALGDACRCLAPGGVIVFTQSFQERPNPWLEAVKPHLRRLTTVDFGRVTYAGAFRDALAAGGLAVDHEATIRRARTRTQRLVAARPA